MKRPAPIGSTVRAGKPRGVRNGKRAGRAAAVRAGLVLLALALAAAPAWTQDEAEPSELDRVLALNYEARGGLEKLRAISSLRATATMSLPGMEIPFTILMGRPNRMYIEGDFGDMPLIQAHDGERSWAQVPGEPKPGALEGEQAAAIASDAAMNAPWFEYGASGHEVELAGKERLDGGEEVWKLVVDGPAGPVRMFIGAEDGLEKKRISKADFGMGIEETTTTFEDYREVGGLMVAHRQIAATGMGDFVLVFETFELDAELDPDVFFMPGQAADAALDLDGVLERYGTARGSAAAEVETVSAAGTVVLLGFEVPMTVAFARPNSFRIDIDMQGLTMVLAYDGETAWNVSPMQGVVDPAPLPEEMVGAVEILSDFLWGGLASSGEASLAGIEKVERDETYRLDIVTPEGEARALYLGGEDFLERRVVFDGAFLQSSGEIDVTIGDYMDAGGLKLPGKIRIAVEGQVAVELRIEEAEAGAEVDSASFTMPAPADPETPGPAL